MRDNVAHEKAYVTPTLILIRHDGKKMLRIVGYYLPEKFHPVLRYLASGRYEHEALGPYLARTEQAPAAAPRPIIADRELFAAPPHILDRRAAPAQRPLLVLLEQPGCAACEQLTRRCSRSRQSAR